MLSKRSLDILLDLIEIKLSAIVVQDKEDVREVVNLKKCRKELIDAKNRCLCISPIQTKENAVSQTC